MLERERFDVLHFHEPFVPFLSLFLLRESTSVNIATFHAYSGFSPAYEVTLKPSWALFDSMMMRERSVDECPGPGHLTRLRLMTSPPMRRATNSTDVIARAPACRVRSDYFCGS